MVDMEEDIEEDMVEDTGDDLSNIINSLTAFDFSNSCILSSPGFCCLLLNIRIKIVHSTAGLILLFYILILHFIIDKNTLGNIND